MDSKRLKIVLIGDGAVGKSLLLYMLRTGEFPSIYIPTVCKYCFLCYMYCMAPMFGGEKPHHTYLALTYV